MSTISILLVDDDADVRALLGDALRAAGHAVEEACDGRQALAMFRAEPRDLVVTDIIMPDGDGIELIGAVKRTSPDTRIVAISGRRHLGALDLLKLASQVGADAVLAKPFPMERLLQEAAGLRR